MYSVLFPPAPAGELVPITTAQNERFKYINASARQQKYVSTLAGNAKHGRLTVAASCSARSDDFVKELLCCAALTRAQGDVRFEDMCARHPTHHTHTYQGIVNAVGRIEKPTEKGLAGQTLGKTTRGPETERDDSTVQTSRKHQ